MIKLKDMISRSLFTESKKLRVFDFDDTLVKTTSFIYITNNGKKKKLTPGEYAVYNEKPGDEFDFSDFSKVQDPNEIKKITKVLRRIVSSSGGDEGVTNVVIGSTTAISTAESQNVGSVGATSNEKSDWGGHWVGGKWYVLFILFCCLCCCLSFSCSFIFLFFCLRNYVSFTCDMNNIIYINFR